jgi:hypothetical protein
MVEPAATDAVTGRPARTAACAARRRAPRVGHVGRMVRHPESIGRTRPSRIRRQDVGLLRAVGSRLRPAGPGRQARLRRRPGTGTA